jgi:choline-glycine betaine transporter
MLPGKILGEFQAMTAWFAAPLALIFALATLAVPPNIKAEKEKSEQTDQGRSKEKSGKADESSSATSKGRRHHRPEHHE